VGLGTFEHNRLHCSVQMSLQAVATKLCLIHPMRLGGMLSGCSVTPIILLCACSSCLRQFLPRGYFTSVKKDSSQEWWEMLSGKCRASPIACKGDLDIQWRWDHGYWDSGLR